MPQRTINEIQESILLKKSQASSLSALQVLTTNEQQSTANLNSNSKVAIWRLWVYIQSLSIFIHEGIFEIHKVEIEELIALNKLHTAKWYKGKALAFQFGFSIGELDYYDNTGVDEALVLNSLVVKQASVEEIGGRLKIKVAGENSSNDLQPLDTAQVTAFTQYMSLVRDAGTRIEVVSRPPDDLALTIDLYFDPLLLDGNGARLDGLNDAPVSQAIEEFLYNLEFNGELILTKLTDYLQNVEGVNEPVIKEASARFGTNPYVDINEYYIADSGYMVLDETLTVINFLPRELL
tara:strand:- start:1255 stop:2133 length:879 start_codon:yes stop_codon:yes gene_type:complete